MDMVVDASATMPWVIPDEKSPWSDNLLHKMRAGANIHVPAHWPTEVSNGLLVAQRRNRIPPAEAEKFWDFFASSPITVHLPPTPAIAKRVFRLAEQYLLTIYDAAYLDLAQRLNLPLATLDKALIRAATAAGSPLVPE